MILERIEHPSDLRGLTAAELEVLCGEIRDFIVKTVSVTGGHLGSNLGAVELTVALHRVFDSPRDLVIFDTGHQAYVHKLITGRRKAFSRLRQEGGLSGYPNRSESAHDWVENSHASTSLSWAHGLATALGRGGGPCVGSSAGSLGPRQRRVVAVVGDGALTGGLAYEALNNLGHSATPVTIVLNDNGRSYAPTVSKLSESLTKLRLSPAYVSTRRRVKAILEDLPPALGPLARSSLAGLTSAVREAIEPHVFFEALGVRYTGPIDGHDIAAMESAFEKAATWNEGPIVVHVLTQKGKGYGPAESDEVTRLHDLKVMPCLPAHPASTPAQSGSCDEVSEAPTTGAVWPGYLEAFAEALLEEATANPRVVALTAAMPGSVGLLPLAARYPDRCFDVGIAEGHAATAAAGMAAGGLKPVVALYATFFSRAFDQVNLDVGLHRLPVVFALLSSGITGPDGPSHHGAWDLAQCLSVPDMVVFAPSSPADLRPMLREALALDVPSAIRFPKVSDPWLGVSRPVGDAAEPPCARRLRCGDGSVCVLAVGKLVAPALEAADLLAASGTAPTVWDVQVVRPAGPAMLADAATHDLVVTVEDGIRLGGAGTHLSDAVASWVSGRRPPSVLNLGLPHRYIAHGRAEDILERLGLGPAGIAASITASLESWPVSPPSLESITWTGGASA